MNQRGDETLMIRPTGGSILRWHKYTVRSKPSTRPVQRRGDPNSCKIVDVVQIVVVATKPNPFIINDRVLGSDLLSCDDVDVDQEGQDERISDDESTHRSNEGSVKEIS